MYLKKVTLKNFRCFEHLELDLHPRLTVLVAENGGGKTAILDGIAFGLAPVLSHLSSANQRLSAPPKKDTDLRMVPKFVRGRKESWVAADYAKAEIETTTGLSWDRIQTNKNAKHSGPKIGQADLASYTSRVFEGLQSDSQELLPVFAYYGARRGWIAVPGRLRESKVNYAYPVSALVGALDSLADFKEMLKWFDREELSEYRANKGLPPEDWDESSALRAVRGAITVILGNAFCNPQFNNKHQFVVESKETPGMSLQVAQLSQGYQSMLALGMDFARRLALANDHLTNDNILPILEANRDWLHLNALENSETWTSPPLFAPAIMLVDEIDLHLHPSWQQRVLGDLMRAFPLTQFIVTTHSPQVLTTVKKECIRSLTMENGVPAIHTPIHETYAQESRTALEDVLDTPSRPPLDITRKIRDYLQRIEDNQDESSDVRQLRDELEKILGAGDSQLQLADMLIARNQAKRSAKK